MDFELEESLQQLINQHQFKEAIELAESKLMAEPITEFHKIIGRDLSHLSLKLQAYVNAFVEESERYYRKGNTSLFRKILTKEKTFIKSTKALFCEMDDFTINYDEWLINLFSLTVDNGLEDLDWLADFEYNCKDGFKITGLEDLQIVYKNYMENEKYKNKQLSISSGICAYLVILRLQELFYITFNTMKKAGQTKNSLPIYVACHDCDLTYRTI